MTEHSKALRLPVNSSLARRKEIMKAKTFIPGICLLIWAACLPATVTAQSENLPTPVKANPASAAEMTLPDTSLLFELDTTVWKERDIAVVKNPGVVARRTFFREKASEMAECPAGLLVLAELVPQGLGVMEYSIQRRVGMPPSDIEGLFAHEDGTIQLQNAVGFRLRGKRGCHPIVHAVYARNGANGFIVILEMDPKDYSLLEAEVRAILKSFRFADGG